MQQARAFVKWVLEPHNTIPVLVTLALMYLAIFYVQSYGRAVPINDQWLFNQQIAYETVNGTLQANDLLGETVGHRPFFTNFLTFLVTITTDWNVSVENAFNFIFAVIIFLLLLTIFRKDHPQKVHLVMVPFALLVFSLHQYLNWLCGAYNAFHFAIMFFLSALWSLHRSQGGWGALLAAAIFAACAMFSQAQGIVTWGVVIVGMWLYGYRKPQHYAFILVAAAALLGFYIAGTPISVDESVDSGSSVAFIAPDDLLSFVLPYLGNPFTYEFDISLATAIAVIGLGLWVANLVALWRLGQRQWIVPWFLLALYPFGSALLQALARFEADYLLYTIEQRFTAISMLFWISLFALMVLNYLQYRETTRFPYLSLANGAVLVLLLVTYMQANIWNMQRMALRYDHVIGEIADVNREETCIREFPLKNNPDCYRLTAPVPLGNAEPALIYQLALGRLSIFADAETDNVLPNTYRAGSPIIMMTQSPWRNLYIRDYLLAGVPQADLHHFAPIDEVHPTRDHQEPLVNRNTLDALADGIAALDNPEELWVIHTSGTQDAANTLPDLLENYTTLFIPLIGEQYEGTDIQMTRYLRIPDDLEEQYRFGESITLQGWDVVGEPEACASLTVESWWMTDAQVPQNYVASLAIYTADGEKLANVDGSLASIEMGVWVPNLLYFDNRSIQLPCDLPSGDYNLGYFLYSLDDFSELPLALPADNLITDSRVMLFPFELE